MRRILTAAALLVLCGFAQTVVAQQTYVSGTQDAWYGYTGAIMLTREDPRHTPVAVTAAGAEVLNSSRFDFGPNFGVETVVGRRFAEGDGIEGRFFDVDLGTSAPDFASGGAVFTPFNDNTFASRDGLTPGPVGVRQHYASNLKNLELNYRAQAAGPFGIIAGFRYVDLSEQLQIGYARPTGTVNIQEINSKNEMWGAQLGSDVLLFSGDRLSLSAFGKSGIFYNDAQNFSRGRFRSAVLTIDSTSGGDSDDELSFVFESGLNAGVQLTERLTFQAGYNIMWLNGVALASDQIAATDLAGGPSRVDTRNLFLHGLTLGATFVW